ncbi:MAG: hypothetical protein GW823_11410, partial [Bacteroidetes bacterium]|nr:hypothetical protein [Bacteroidota bacterium]
MKKSRLIFSIMALGIDFIVLSLSFLLAYHIRTNIDIRPLANPTTAIAYIKLVLTLSTIGIIIFFFAGLYNIKKPESRIDELKKIFLAVSTGVMMIIILDFVKTQHI